LDGIIVKQMVPVLTQNYIFKISQQAAQSMTSADIKNPQMKQFVLLFNS